MQQRRRALGPLSERQETLVMGLRPCSPDSTPRGLILATVKQLADEGATS